MGHAGSTDVELVEASVNGRVDAFTALVERYQSLVCAVSYSATGDRALSEDVAQETFVAAWNGLSELREPSKLRGWLCGIARNLSSKAMRRVGREIPSDAEVQAAINQVAAAPSPLDDALEKESEQLVWTALHNIPETYREPLVLFYREDQSTKQVAEALGLSENAVGQRLSRGRQHLKASVADLVERTLERTKPTKGFSAGVLAAISAGAMGTAEAASAEAASSGASASAGSMLALTAGLLTMKTLKIGAVAIVLVLLALGGVSVMEASRSEAGSESKGAGEALSAGESGHESEARPSAFIKPPSPAPPRVGAGTGASSAVEAGGTGNHEEENTSATITTSAVFAMKDAAAELADECFVLAQTEAPTVTGKIVASFELITDPEAGHLVTAVDLDPEKSTLINKAFDECIKNNLLGVESEIERLREQGDDSYGPIRLHLSRTYPGELGRRWDVDDEWPEAWARPVCPPQTHPASDTEVHPSAWCERDTGVKHGEHYIYGKEGRVAAIQEWEDGQSSNLRIRRPSTKK